MAEPATLRGDQLLIKVGDGADPEVFTHPCLINTTRGISFTTDSNTVIVPDCANPSDPAWSKVIKASMSATVTGAGTLDLASVETYFNLLKSPNAKNLQVVVGVLADTTGGYFAGAFQLTDFEITGERGGLAEVSITLQSDGAVTFTAHS